MTPSSALLVGVFFVVAFAYSNIGLGGGLLYFPILAWAHPEWSPATLVAMTLLCSIMTLLASAVGHQKAGLVQRRHVLVLALPMALGAFGGARFTIGAAAPLVKGVFSIVLLSVAARMSWKMWQKHRGGAAQGEGEQVQGPPSRLRALGVSSAGVGLLSGSVGIGGGAVLVPLLMSLGRLETRQAIGTASAALLLTASCGFATYLCAHEIEAPGGLSSALAAASLVGATAGVRVGLKAMKGEQVRALFISALVLAGLWTGLMALRAL